LGNFNWHNQGDRLSSNFMPNEVARLVSECIRQNGSIPPIIEYSHLIPNIALVPSVLARYTYIVFCVPRLLASYNCVKAIDVAEE
jgi:hypothetical protein